MTTEPDAMRVDRPLLLLLAALTAGCADPEPFVDFGSSITPTVSKPLDPVLQNGPLKLCYSDKTPWPEVEQLAAERCSAHGLTFQVERVERWQCRATSPHRAFFRCFDPEMRREDGSPINPFDPTAVKEWEKRTGKTARPHTSLGAQGGAAITPPASTEPPPTTDAIPSAPVTTTQPPAPAPITPLNPGDIAGKPPMPTLPPRQNTQPPPPPAEAYPADGFTLPQGSWGDHFQE